MTLKVWLFCLLAAVGCFIGTLLLEFQTTMLWKAAVVRAAYFFIGSLITAFYFTRPGYLEKLIKQ